ncbi:MAG: adhesion protein FadA [Fusobacteriaceae bacterium]|jgi:hypothetical protein|nr:adhesion protein FadA [Fusobacteriaceae bacterium]
MKKFLLVSVVLAAFSLALPAAEASRERINELEASLQALQQQEQAMLEARRQEAVSAQERLRGQKSILAQIQKREAQIEKFKDYKFFKPEYKLLKDRYTSLRKELEGEMRKQDVLIKNLTTK